MRDRGWVLLGLVAAGLFGGGAIVLSDWKKRGERYLPLLNAAEQRYNIPRDLLARLAYQESRWRDDIVSGRTQSAAGAQGLMQIVPAYHPSVNPLDINEAIEYAARYLANLKVQFGSWPLALAAYNAGPGNVRKYGGIPPFAETQAYVREITGDVKI